MTTHNTNVQQSLVNAGFNLVMRETQILGAKGNHSNLLAWAPDGSGSLVPWTAVEMSVQKVKPPHPALALQRLAVLRDQLGTREHYLVINDTEWLKADSGLQTLEKVDGPTPPRFSGHGTLDDADMLTEMLQEQLWRATDNKRSFTTLDDRSHLIAEAISSPSLQPALSQAGVDVDTYALWKAQRRVVQTIERSSRAGKWFRSHATVADATAALLGDKLKGTLINPFCGTGSLLWSAIDLAAATKEGLKNAVGYGPSEVAVILAENSPVPVEFLDQDPLQTSTRQANCVVSTPPLGLRLTEPHHLLDGSTTRDIDLAAVDSCIRKLEPGGRAVLHLSQGLTTKKQNDGYRRYLANNFRIAALIGLPSNAFYGTAIPSVILVVDATAPTPTFIAQLGSDWGEQLSPSGSALKAARNHIDGVQS